MQDSWKPTSQLTIEGGVRWVLWPPWYSTTNNIANFDPRFYDPAQAADHQPGHRSPDRRQTATTASCCRATASRATAATGSPDPAVQALFRGEPRGFSETHYNVFSRGSASSYQLNEKTVVRASGGIFHNRVTLNDSTLLGGNAPFQPMVTVANGDVDNPAGGTARCG